MAEHIETKNEKQLRALYLIMEDDYPVPLACTKWDSDEVILHNLIFKGISFIHGFAYQAWNKQLVVMTNDLLYRHENAVVEKTD